MKKLFLTLSLWGAVTALFSLPHTSAAQLLSRAQTKPDRSAFDGRPSNTRLLKRALSELERRYNVNFAYDETMMAGRMTGTELDGNTLEQTLTTLLNAQGLSFKKIKSNL